MRKRKLLGYGIIMQTMDKVNNMAIFESNTGPKAKVGRY